MSDRGRMRALVKILGRVVQVLTVAYIVFAFVWIFVGDDGGSGLRAAPFIMSVFVGPIVLLVAAAALRWADNDVSPGATRPRNSP